MRRAACFLAVTYGVTWSAWFALAATGRVVATGFSPLYLLGLLGPFVGAVVTTAVFDGREGLRDLFARMVRIRVGLRWWGVALGVPIAVAAVTYVILVTYSIFLLAPVPLPRAAAFGQFVGFPITSWLALCAMLILINGFGEETGWRGFLLPAMQRRWSPLTASLMVAAFWALWHAPAFLVNTNYRAMPIATLPMFFAGLACGSLFLTWLYNRGQQSIALVAVWHGVFNLLTGTVAARGPLAAMETTAVMVIAIVLLTREVRASVSDRSTTSASALSIRPCGDPSAK